MRPVGVTHGGLVKRAVAAVVPLVLGLSACGPAPSISPQSRTLPTGSTRPILGHPLGREIGRPITADVDGDGVPDTAVLREWGHVWGGLRDALVVRTGSGRQLRLAIDDDMGSSRYPMNKLLGADDVNGDGRDELVVFTSGNTELAGVIVTDVDGRLRAARTTEGVPYFSAHGNSCGPCTQDATCQMWRGKPRLVETESFYLSRRGRDLTLFEMAATHDNAPFDEHRRRWQATVYDLREDRFVKIKTLHGVVAAGAPLPRDFHFDGALDCGSAHLHL